MAHKSRRTRRLRVVNPDCAGIDIGKDRHFVAVDPERSDEPLRSFGAFTRDLEEMAAWLASCGVTKVAMESTSVYWIAVYETLERAGFEVMLVPPRMTKQIGGRKSEASAAAPGPSSASTAAASSTASARRSGSGAAAIRSASRSNDRRRNARPRRPVAHPCRAADRSSARARCAAVFRSGSSRIVIPSIARPSRRSPPAAAPPPERTAQPAQPAPCGARAADMARLLEHPGEVPAGGPAEAPPERPRRLQRHLRGVAERADVRVRPAGAVQRPGPRGRSAHAVFEAHGHRRPVADQPGAGRRRGHGQVQRRMRKRVEGGALRRDAHPRIAAQGVLQASAVAGPGAGRRLDQRGVRRRIAARRRGVPGYDAGNGTTDEGGPER